MTPTPQLRTPGVIARELGEPIARVLYVLHTQGHVIRPIGRAGCIRLYDRAAVGLVRDALLGRRTSARKAVSQ